MKSQNGFTLIELLIVVAVIGILAGVALPAYREYITRGQLTEAATEMASRRVLLEQYFQDNKNYGSTNASCGVAMPAGKYFDFTCTWGASSDDKSFIITATGKATEAANGFVYTVNQDNVKGTTASPWGTSATCWVIKRGGIC